MLFYNNIIKLIYTIYFYIIDIFDILVINIINYIKNNYIRNQYYLLRDYYGINHNVMNMFLCIFIYINIITIFIILIKLLKLLNRFINKNLY
jgi:hypothetical protein